MGGGGAHGLPGRVPRRGHAARRAPPRTDRARAVRAGSPRLRARQGALRARVRARQPADVGVGSPRRPRARDHRASRPRRGPASPGRGPVRLHGLHGAQGVRRPARRERAAAGPAHRRGPARLDLLPHARLPAAPSPRDRPLPQRLRDVGGRSGARPRPGGAPGDGRPGRLHHAPGLAGGARVGGGRAPPPPRHRAPGRVRGTLRLHPVTDRRDPDRDRGAHAPGAPGRPARGRPERALLSPRRGPAPARPAGATTSRRGWSGASGCQSWPPGSRRSTRTP